MDPEHQTAPRHLSRPAFGPLWPPEEQVEWWSRRLLTVVAAVLGLGAVAVGIGWAVSAELGAGLLAGVLAVAAAVTVVRQALTADREV